MKKKLAAIALLALVLTGCGYKAAENANYDKGSFYEQNVELNDGRSVHCLFWASDSDLGGMSCDWGSAG